MATYEEMAKSNCEELENILGDHALIFYTDSDLEECCGWQIFPDCGEPGAFHPCNDADAAYRKLSRMGFIF